jgi:hypothetical protein
VINSLVVQTLNSLNVPVSFQRYTGKESTYITFFEFMEQGELYADNEEKATGYYIQVDVWSKDDYIDLAENVKSLMIAAGFMKTYAADLFERDTRIYHKVIRFYYLC